MTDAALTPSPTKSALLGFLGEVWPGNRYAIYPAGRYTSACMRGVGEEVLESQGRTLVGFIDDFSDSSTHDGDLMKRIDALQDRKRSIRVITQPTPTPEAMGAHLGSYSPSCPYPPAFVRACQRHESKTKDRWPSQSTLLCTLDGEVFLGATDEQVADYPRAMRESLPSLTTEP